MGVLPILAAAGLLGLYLGVWVKNFQRDMDWARQRGNPPAGAVAPD